MKASPLTLSEIFQAPARYTVPTFQRPYVWTQEDQWEPLWIDVRDTAERFIEYFELSGVQGGTIDAGEQPSHFMGAIVLQQQPVRSGLLPTREVIDGQQRLTTLQILLDAAQEEYVSLDPNAAERLQDLVFNKPAHAGKDADHQFKIWPTLNDRDAFRHAMRNELPAEEYDESLIVQCHDFFRAQIREWVEKYPETRIERADALEQTLRQFLRVVVIDLEDGDDAQAIFETLNDRGTPLRPYDLAKNFILHQVAGGAKEQDRLYEAHMKDLETPFWRTEVGSGRLRRPRNDAYLNYWLAMRTRQEISTRSLFSEFQKYAKGDANVEAVARDLGETGPLYRRLEELNDDSRLGVFLTRWRQLQAAVFTPLLLRLLSSDQTQPTIERCLDALESYLVRRMACRMTTKDYHEVSLGLLKRLHERDAESADSVVIEYLNEQTAAGTKWPSDDDVAEAFLTLPLYKLLTRVRLRLILEGVEQGLRSPKAERSQVPSRLTIEHVMPQHWREHWDPPHSVDDSDAEAMRDRIVHSMGNLTLVTKKLNPALSNSRWEKKREGIDDHSTLFLNKDLLKNAPNEWDESEIAKRAQRLAHAAIQIWPGPDAI